jgi:hypothetical protein
MLVFDADELLHHEFDDELYLVEPIIPMGGDGIIYGRRGCGKTQAAFTLIREVLRGGEFLQQFKCKKGKVAYVMLDMPPQVLQDRLRHFHEAWQTGYKHQLRFYYNDHRINIVDEVREGNQWLLDLAEYEADLIIVDTLRNSHNLDENSSDTPVEVFGAWREALGGHPTILHLHHERKTTEFGDVQDAMRGSGAWLDECDVGIRIKHDKKKDQRVISFPRIRTCAPDEVMDITCKMDPDSLLLLPGKPIEQFLQNAQSAGMSKSDVVKDLQDKNKWGKDAMSQPTAYRRANRAFATAVSSHLTRS